MAAVGRILLAVMGGYEDDAGFASSGPAEGYSVWAHCFDDAHIQDFIESTVESRECDFCRRKSRARQIYDALPLMPNLRAALESAIQSAEDQAQRAYLWGTPGIGTVPARDHVIHERLHRAFVDQIDILANYPRVWPMIVAALNKIVRSSGSAKICLVFPCSHFDRCYALNRFLVLLLARYYELERGETVLYPNIKVNAVLGTTHKCASDPATCYGQTHTVAYLGQLAKDFRH